MLKHMTLGAATALALVLLQPATGARADEAVTIKSFAFGPQEVTIKVGETVTWTNEDGAPHSVVDKGGAFKSAKLAKGDTFSQTFAAAGTFDYKCGFHGSMTGKVVVTP